MSIRVATLSGRDFNAALPALARLRMTVFRDWPYLYDGTQAYEHEYLEKFRSTHGAIIVAAYDGDEIVGCATATPLRGHAEEFAAPFVAAGIDIKRVFYFSESVLLHAYRGRGIGNAFFDRREEHVADEGGYQQIAFCGVVRPAAHPARPKDYVPLDAFWMKRGYRRADGLVASFNWKDVGSDRATAKQMQFWMKSIA